MLELFDPPSLRTVAGAIYERKKAAERVAQLNRQPVAVLADLPGPKIRAGAFAEGGVRLVAGEMVTLVPGSGPSDADRICVPYATLVEDLHVGSRVQLGDGAIAMRVTEVRDDSIVAVFETGGEANGRPGVHLSSESLRLPSPTARDLELADAVADAGVEFIAVSFVRRAADVDQVRAVVGDRAQLVSKIETSAAIDQLHEVIAASDVLMVARGDLGVDGPAAADGLRLGRAEAASNGGLSHAAYLPCSSTRVSPS